MYGLGIVGEKITAFTQRVVNAKAYLIKKKEGHLADQFYRSGTSIGANCSEAVGASSRADYVNKLTIALKEANETRHWIEVMYMSHLIDEKTYNSILEDCVEICKLLTTIIKRNRASLQQHGL